MEQRMIRLVGVGMWPAVHAHELKEGMRTVWNYGDAFDVVAVRPKGRKSVVVTLRRPGESHTYDRMMMKTRLVAVGKHQGEENHNAADRTPG